MPVAVSYPGVYVEEVSSGVRTITGVATSITAFLGRAPRGPTNEASLVLSFADFERRFGGLARDYPMSYAIRDFFANSGATAIVVRLFVSTFADNAARTAALAAAKPLAVAGANAVAKAANDAAAPAAAKAGDVVAAASAALSKLTGPGLAAGAAVVVAAQEKARQKDVTAKNVADAAQDAKADAATAAAGAAAPWDRATLTLAGAGGALVLEAAEPGAWGNRLRAALDHETKKDDGGSDPKLFNLFVRDEARGRTETFLNVSVDPGYARNLERVLKNESSLVRVAGTLPAARPNATIPPAAAGEPPISADKRFERGNSKGVDPEGQADDGAKLTSDEHFTGKPSEKTGLYALEKADLFNLLCIPADTPEGDTPQEVYAAALDYCVKRDAMLIVDPPHDWSTKPETAAQDVLKGLSTGITLSGPATRNAALFFPRLQQVDPLRDGQLAEFVPCGMVAGVFARTDSERGVWKAPAGIDAALVGTAGLTATLTDQEHGLLNPLGVNVLRAFPVYGRVIWGARTLRGADQLADEYKYIPVRRLALFLKESLFRGTQWVVFEPNDEPLWSQIRLNIGAFMHNLFRQGAFQGRTPRDAYFVKCDNETTTQADINLGIVNIVVGFAPLKPAEFVIIRLQQIAGDIET